MRKPVQYYERERRKGRLFSLGIHVLVLLIAYFGLPLFMQTPPPEEPVAISVEIVPITGITNMKPSTAEPAPEPKKPEKEPEQKKPAPPVKTADATPPPPPPEPAPTTKPKEKIAEVKKPEPKPEPKKPEKKPKPDDLEAVLKAVKDTAQKEKQNDKNKDHQDASNAPKRVSSQYDPSLPMSMSERDAIMSQIAKCWSPPLGAKDADKLQPRIDAEYTQDGSLISAGISDEDKSRYSSDNFFRAAADSALRAVKECHQLTGLPPEKYDTWRSMELQFDPKFLQ